MWRDPGYMYRILIPVDTDDRRADGQVKTALRLAEEVDELDVTVLHVHEEIDSTADEAGRSYIDELNEQLDEIHGTPSAVTVVTDQLEPTAVSVTVHEIIGKPAPAILEIGEELDVDAILLGVRKRSPVGKVLFGSVTQAVILSADRPVMTAPAPELE